MSQSKVIKSSAPGKVILHGEYAVVFGKHAVAVSVNLRTTVNLQVPSVGDDVSITLNSLGSLKKSWSLEKLRAIKLPVENGFVEYNSVVDECLSALIPDDPTIDGISSCRVFLFLYLSISDIYSVIPLPMALIVDSEFPVGAGLGSSAAYSVAITGALFRAFKPDLCQDLDLINRWAYQCERLFHGKPSGIDNSICTFGGAILFKEGNILDKIENLKNQEIILVYTNVRRNTKILVGQASKRRESFPEIISHTMDAIDNVSQQAWKSLRTQIDAESRKILIDMNQHLLQVVGAGHEKIDEVVKIAKNFGCSAKLTGAGGGGCVIIQVEKDTNRDQLILDLEQNSFVCWTLSVGGCGLATTSTTCLN